MIVASAVTTGGVLLGIFSLIFIVAWACSGSTEKDEKNAKWRATEKKSLHLWHQMRERLQAEGWKHIHENGRPLFDDLDMVGLNPSHQFIWEVMREHGGTLIAAYHQASDKDDGKRGTYTLFYHQHSERAVPKEIACVLLSAESGPEFCKENCFMPGS